MQNQPLYTEQISEQQFRQLAGLCESCGLSRYVDAANLCANCNQRQQIGAMERQWREWGIAA